MSVLMMEANTVSEIVDTNSICKWLIVQEDWLQKLFYCNTIENDGCNKDEWLLNCTKMLHIIC